MYPLVKLIRRRFPNQAPAIIRAIVIVLAAALIAGIALLAAGG